MTPSPYLADDKDPASIVAYSIDWTDELGTDTILSSSWNVPAPFVLVSQGVSGYIAQVTISGGAAGRTLLITNTITTNGGSKETRSLQIFCRQL